VVTWVPAGFREVLVGSGLFDPAWYRRRYRNLDPSPRSASTLIDHFLTVGLAHNLDPGPRFSASRYLMCNPDVAAAGLHPVVHYLTSGLAEGRAPHLVPPDRDPIPRRRRRRRRVLVVAHAAGEQLFGAERSLLDILDGFAALGIDTVVAVPPTSNTAYLRELQQRCRSLETVLADGSDTDGYAVLIDRHRVDAVHVNTIVPIGALAAARSRQIPAVVNVREIPADDPALCAQLGYPDAASAVQAVLDAADYLIAPSMVAAAHYPLPTGCTVVPCVVDVERFAGITRPTDRPLRVGLVGQLSEKKGIDDLVELAGRWEQQHGDPYSSGVQFVAVGSETPESEALRLSPTSPSNLEWVGYRPSPVAALTEIDVLLALSHCIEAFGRTVLEAAAAGAPSIAYRRGGPLEVIVDGVTGFLVEPGDVDAVLDRIDRLRTDPELRSSMGSAAQHRARHRYSADVLVQSLADAYRSILPSRRVIRARRRDVLIPIHTVNRSPHTEPFYVNHRGRFAGCTSVRFVDDHLIATASLLGRRLHLIRLSPDRSAATMVSTTPIPHWEVDLLNLDGTGRLLTSDCNSQSVSLWRVTSDAIVELERTIPMGGAEPGYVHGTSFIAGEPSLIAAAITTGTPRVSITSLDGSPAPHDIERLGWRPKAVGSFPGHLVIAYARNNVNQFAGQWHDSCIELVRLLDDRSHRVLGTVDLPAASADSIAITPLRRGRYRILAADQAHDSIARIDVRITRSGAARMRRRSDVIGASFPHDAALSPDGRLMAIAEYGTDSIRLRPMSRWRR